MPWFEIIVQYESGEAATGRRVRNGYNFQTTYTDSSGKATFEVGTSRVTLYVDGQDKGTITPGRTVVTVR